MVTSSTQFIYTLRPKRVEMLATGPTPGEASVLRQHFEYLEHLSRQGAVLLAGRTQTTDQSTFGIVILRASSEAAAKRIMAEDPAVLGDLMDGQLFPYRIAVISPSILNDQADDA